MRRTREDGNLAIFLEGNMSGMPSFYFFSPLHRHTSTIILYFLSSWFSSYQEKEKSFYLCFCICISLFFMLLRCSLYRNGVLDDWNNFFFSFAMCTIILLLLRCRLPAPVSTTAAVQTKPEHIPTFYFFLFRVFLHSCGNTMSSQVCVRGRALKCTITKNKEKKKAE